jgi:hypothetical protein
MSMTKSQLAIYLCFDQLILRMRKLMVLIIILIHEVLAVLVLCGIVYLLLLAPLVVERAFGFVRAL